MSDDLLDGYRSPADRYDELLTAEGPARAHWRPFLDDLRASSPAQLAERMAMVEREIREHGITYNVYADPQGADRPWTVDPVPLLVDAADWALIEEGVAQRARLFNLILQDLYGPQHLLREGLIPAALVYGHRGYLHPARDIRPPGGIHLFQYAADLARSPDGQWWVFSDRTQAPSGMGYALENRLMVSRMFPEAFARLRVQHHAAFFATWRESLSHFAPRGDGPQLIVLLTPGPYNETYFEHALLARYLGFVLVEGSDLTVRQGKVWLKTVEGLRRVHAIVRRQDDDYCDPLELRADSALGVPGLTECARRGSVLLANGLGAGVLESGALLGYLPALCEHLLGEPLRLPSVATWWLGEPAALDDAWAQLEDLVIKPADRSLRMEPVAGHSLDDGGRAAVRAQIERQPHRYVAQEWVRLSQAPVLERERPLHLASRPVGLRAFAVATPDGHAVMPGGLVRVGLPGDTEAISMQRGGGSKDAWVLSDEPVNSAFSLLRTTVTPEDLGRSKGHLSSRAAENLFWFGRYGERCDASARLLRVALSRSVSETAELEDGAVAALVLAQDRGLLGEAQDPADATTALLLAATRSDQGLGAVLAQLARAGFHLRDRLSLDHWRILQQLAHDEVFQLEASLPVALNWLDRAVVGLMTLSGFALDGMTRGTDWRFLSIGRRVERLCFLTQALGTALRAGPDSGLDWLLELCDSSVTYRSRFLVAPEWLPVLDLLLRDDSNPRSVGFQVRGLLDFVQRLEAQHGAFAGHGLARAGDALARLAPADLDPDNPALARLLQDLHNGAQQLSDHITHRFFTHAQPRSLLHLAA
jgi:uncharacterized circularly permuted ATP-grasp superfamily protein/uncharacterized alpha-E superfamily protein